MRNEKKNPVEKRMSIHDETYRLRKLAIESLEQIKKKEQVKIKYDLKN